jgi:hypothetical protein
MPILKCPSCKPHEFQDRTYGNMNRVHNPTMKQGGTAAKPVIFRCTVCLNEKSASGDIIAKR